MNKASSGLVARILVVWFVIAMGVGVSGTFFYATPRTVAATVWSLTLLSLFTVWKVERVRQAVMAAGLRTLVAVHLVRFVGMAFVALFLAGRFPFSFGFLGGVGDTLVALGAVALLGFVLPPVSPGRRTVLIWWNAFGLLDILAVVFSALREGLRDPALMAPLRQFPLNLLPLYFVPLIIGSHVVIAVRARWNVDPLN